MDERPAKALEELDEQLRQAQERRDGGSRKDQRKERGSGLSLALRIGVELVAALIVGVGIGLLLDRWLDTTPWFLLLFFLLGSAAGVTNVIRVTKDLGGAVGYKPSETADGPAGGQPKTGGTSKGSTVAGRDEE